jgi:tRNA dimethylallyltransferase
MGSGQQETGGRSSRPAVFSLVGSTASGKKTVGVAVARLIDAEIISLDSMKVYRGMDIGTAKPSPRDREQAAIHMLDLIDPSESFSVGEFLSKARDLVEQIHGRGRRVLFLGGTAFYLNCLINGLFDVPVSDPALRVSLQAEAEEKGTLYLHGRLRGADPDSAAAIHPHDLKRIVRALEVIQTTGAPMSRLKRDHTVRVVKNRIVPAGLRWPAEITSARVRARTKRMIDLGLVEEVRRILEGSGFGPEAGKAIGYREIVGFLHGRHSLSDASEAINRHSLRFVRKQATWYRRFEEIRWFEPQSANDLSVIVDGMAGYFRESGANPDSRRDCSSP